MQGAGGSSIDSYLTDCRGYVLDEIRTFLPTRGPCSEMLYDLMLEYPLRKCQSA
jgi:hypothetical protein